MKKPNIQRSKSYLTKQSNNRTQNVKCPNCGNLHWGHFCNNCGQSVELVKKPFKDIFIDVIGSLYAFDFRLWRSVRTMFTRPEKLSEAFLDGKRASFTPPFKLYFFVSFIFFFVMSWKTNSSLDENNDVISTSDSTNISIGNVEIDSIKNNQFSFSLPVDAQSKIDTVKQIKTGDTKRNKYFNFSDERIKEILINKEGRKLFLSKAYKYCRGFYFY